MELAKQQQVIREELGEEMKIRKGHFHVLAVDDSLIERKMLEKLLTISSYHVTCVESGDKALEYLGLVDRTPHNVDDHDHHHDASAVDHSLSSPDHIEVQGQGTRVNLIMTDFSIPGISGYDLLKRVKGSSWKDVPVVLMSSENVPSRIDMCLEGGAEDFLLKPVKLSDLKKLQPHILKSTSTKDYTGENRSSLVANNNNNNCDYKEEIIVNDYASGYDKGKAKIDGEHFDRRPQLEGLTTV